MKCPKCRNDMNLELDGVFGVVLKPERWYCSKCGRLFEAVCGRELSKV
jgi:hypothetical protein